ncbi:poly-gamma-glutamate synthesis protein (capsule biosynthesis protein) [Sinosporangium album]|uniref:Poly-gamma-glutamate synthesis protein (Capsule biosynthesis protein) n=1 Tax=Sinosporangium album TaxID=504805 RepID=A0A1G7U6H7_9ACTN|nr:CapA family protein [Sinosporangium album]SDG42968.1 poly-gamma-glutamate synthesis protein (capsule biosynthesis protein) [Sinosporangium album]
MNTRIRLVPATTDSLRIGRVVGAAITATALLTVSCSAAESAERPAIETKAATSAPAESPEETRPTSQRKPYTIAFGGDVHFEGLLRARLNNPRTAFGPIAPVLRRADLAVINLETAVTTGGRPAPGKQYVFRAPPSALTALKAAGVDTASLANNHGMDFMESGLADSLANAKRAKFPLIGVGRNAAEAYRPFRRTVNGNRVAIIAATQVLDSEFIQAWTATNSKPGLASAKNEPRLLHEVRAARRDSDTVVVFLHWGAELVACPTEVQRSLARRLISAGADVIVGGHAHILLGSGYMSGRYVNYGLGNFVFYNWGPKTGKTGVLTLTINGRKVLKEQWTPATIQGGVPVPVTGAAGRQALTSWKSLRGCAGLSAAPGDDSTR